jgi:hypothetical protein
MLLDFLDTIKNALTTNIFVSLTLSGYKGTDENLKNIYLKKIIIKGEEKLSFTYRYKTNDIVKNFSFIEAIKILQELLINEFTIANLFTLENDWVLEKKDDNFVVKKNKPSKKEIPSLQHNQEKKYLFNANSYYLHLLNITDAKGNVFKTTQDKFRQINHYIEILSSLLNQLPTNKTINIADMGSGKGYLTFALYNYLTQNLKLNTSITGIEFRKDLVEFCNSVAQKSKFTNLQFIQGTIESYVSTKIDVLIALHACDTATDDAIAKGIKANAKLIVVAPCCHKQIRKEIEKSKKENDISFITQHGIFLERQAEMITDSIRAMVLEYFGYKTKVFEFITDAHTPKNIMITAVKIGVQKNEVVSQKIKNAKAFFGIREHYLEKLVF